MSATIRERIDAPPVEAIPAIEAALEHGGSLIVQFAAAPYSSAVLTELNRLADSFGEALEVRFFAHERAGFDCATLAKLPNVARLSVDCLTRVENLGHLAALERLSALSLGVWELPDGAILRAENLRRLSELVLGETRRQVMDLSALSAFTRLTLLRLAGHTRNLRVLADLPALRSLSLKAVPRTVGLDFLGQHSGVRALTLRFGGRETLTDVELPELEELEVVRVRGLRSLGDLGRFPQLRTLVIEDQPQLEQIQLSAANVALRQVRVINCPRLRALAGLEAVPNLEVVRVVNTAVEPSALRRDRLATSLRALAFGSGKVSLDRSIRRISAHLGYEQPAEQPGILGIDWRRAP